MAQRTASGIHRPPAAPRTPLAPLPSYAVSRNQRQGAARNLTVPSENGTEAERMDKIRDLLERC